MSRTVAIVQARMTSKRLPGKMMMELGGKPVLQHVIERAKSIGADSVIVAMPDSKSSDSMISLARRMLVGVHLGSEDDVLQRYYDAAKIASAAFIVRITGDCPMLDPEVCRRVIDARKHRGTEYASNVLPRSFPKGLDCEVFTFQALELAVKKAENDYDREHVTPWMVRNCSRINLASGRFDLAKLRWTLDTIKDLEFMREVFSHGAPMSWERTLEIIERFGITNKETA